MGIARFKSSAVLASRAQNCLSSVPVMRALHVIRGLCANRHAIFRAMITVGARWPRFHRLGRRASPCISPAEFRHEISPIRQQRSRDATQIGLNLPGQALALMWDLCRPA